jgi:chorismate-pyruvate lyase
MVVDMALLACLSLCPDVAGAAADPPGAAPAAAPLTPHEAVALMRSVQDDIRASGSATLALQRWCRNHDLAVPPEIRARRIGGKTVPPSAATRRRLALREGEVVRFRRVELACGGHVLSVADNWYVPARLSAQMNRALETTQTPFGAVVRELRPQRRRIGTPRLLPPPALFEERAVLYAAGQGPIAEVHEVYQRELAAPVPTPEAPDAAPGPDGSMRNR